MDEVDILFSHWQISISKRWVPPKTGYGYRPHTWADANSIT
jgi:hypothetical protein